MSAAAKDQLGAAPAAPNLMADALREKHRRSRGDAPESEPVDGPAPVRVPVRVPVRESEPEDAPGGAQEPVDGPGGALGSRDTGGPEIRAQGGAQAREGVAEVLSELDRATKSYVAGLAKLQPRRDRLAAAIAAYIAAGGHAADVRSRFAAAGIATDDIPREATEALRKR